MKATTAKTTETANFSHSELPATIVHDAIEHTVAKPTIVINLGGAPAVIDEDLGGCISPISSTILTGGTTVSGELLACIPLPAQQLDEAHFRDQGWEDFAGAYAPGAAPGTPVLLKSSQHVAGRVRLTPAEVLADEAAPAESSEFEVKINLWFSPAGTDCGIHREHSFIENHTQILGVGRMQKFRENEHSTIYEDQSLAPGQTQPSIFGRWQDDGFAYPWHQYRADTDAVWLALEYHAVSADSQ